MSFDYKGKFIVLDGPDGCGKSTQAEKLRGYISELGVDVVSFRDPGTTAVGEKIRDILLDTEHTQMADNVEVLLYMAARAQLWKEMIAPALEQGKCVVMDRWLSSTCAYQGNAGGFGIERVLEVASLTLDRLWPDITIILDVNPNKAFARIDRNFDRMELKGEKYHQLVREGYLKLSKIASELKQLNLSLISGEGTIEQVHASIVQLLNCT